MTGWIQHDADQSSREQISQGLSGYFRDINMTNHDPRNEICSPYACPPAVWTASAVGGITAYLTLLSSPCIQSSGEVSGHAFVDGVRFAFVANESTAAVHNAAVAEM